MNPEEKNKIVLGQLYTVPTVVERKQTNADGKIETVEENGARGSFSVPEIGCGPGIVIRKIEWINEKYNTICVYRDLTDEQRSNGGCGVCSNFEENSGNPIIRV